MALNVGIEAMFGGMYDWKGMLEKAGKLRSTNAFI
jgi:hypothetical protein